MSKKTIERAKTRESGIELLRILTMCGVILLHYNKGVVNGAFSYVKEGTINYYFLYFMEALCSCAVDLFVLISGYYLCVTQKRKVIKPIELILQVMLYNGLVFLLNLVLQNGTFRVGNFLLALVPNNYFVILYATLYIISPYINLLLEHLSSLERKKLMIAVGLLFSVWPTLVDLWGEIIEVKWVGLSTIGMYGSQWGYSMVNFILLYLVGAYIRLEKWEQKKIDTKTLVLCTLGCSVLLTIWSMRYVGSAREYCNPFIICEAVTIFLLFRKLHFYSRIVNRLAEAAFTVFLLHNFFLTKIRIDLAVEKSFGGMILHLLCTIVGIYIICYCIYVLYDLMKSILEKYIWLKIKSTK